MASGLIGLIKQAALEAVNNSQVCDLRYGEVVSVSPIKVKITSQLIIPSSLLVVPQNLTTYQVLLNDEPVTIDNSLKLGDKVALLRKQGGQSYFILDRI